MYEIQRKLFSEARRSREISKDGKWAGVRVMSVRTFQGYICLVRLLCWPTSPLSGFEFVFQIIIGVNISERKSGTERTKKQESLFFHRRGAQHVTTWILPELRYNPGYLYHGRESRALPVWYDYVSGRFDLCVTFIT